MLYASWSGLPGSETSFARSATYVLERRAVLEARIVDEAFRHVGTKERVERRGVEPLRAGGGDGEQRDREVHGRSLQDQAALAPLRSFQ
jgi:hypothetical protein